MDAFPSQHNQPAPNFYGAPMYAGFPPMGHGMVHSSSTGSLTGMAPAGQVMAGPVYVSQSPSMGSLTGMVQSTSTGSLNGLQQIGSTNSLPQVNSNGSLVTMPIHQPQGWFGKITNFFTPQQQAQPPIMCFDSPEGHPNPKTDNRQNTPPVTVTSPTNRTTAQLGQAYNVQASQQSNPMNLFLGGFPMVSPHGVMANVKPVMVGGAAGFGMNGGPGLARSDSWVSLASLNSENSQNSDNQLQTQDSLSSVEAIPVPGAVPQYQAQAYQAYQDPQQQYHQQKFQKQHNRNPYQQSYQQNYNPHQQQQWNQQNNNQRQWNNNHRKKNKSRRVKKAKVQTLYGENQNHHQHKDFDSRRNDNQNNVRDRNYNRGHRRRDRRSKHQPPQFSDPDACKFCRTKRKYIKQKVHSADDICTILLPRKIDENMVPETFGERWEASDFFQFVDFFDTSRLNEFQYFKVPRTHTEENEAVNTHMLIEIFGRQLGFRRDRIPKRFKYIPLHTVSGCEARTMVRESIDAGMQALCKRSPQTWNHDFAPKFQKLLHRYVGCVPMVDLCGETIPDLWTGIAESKSDVDAQVISWTYYFLVTWDNFHLFVEEIRRPQTAV